MNSYDAGDAIRLVGTFTNTGGTPTDPSAVYLHLVPPQRPGFAPGTVRYSYADGSITRQAAGSYTYDINPLPAGTYGIWNYWYVGTGNCNAAFAGAFDVRQGPTT